MTDNLADCRCIKQCAMGEVDEGSKALIRSLIRPAPVDALWICALNRDVHLHNAEKLSQLPGPLWTNIAVDNGSQRVLEQVTGAKKHVHLKIGVPIIITANINDELVNGTRGYVTHLDPNRKYITIKLQDGSTKNVSKFTFSRYGRSMLHTRLQFPVQLAWALTIHRAQGQTLEKVHVLCSGLFLPGHFSVAISRVRDAANLSIEDLDLSALKPIDREVQEFIATGRVPLQVSNSIFKLIIP